MIASAAVLRAQVAAKQVEIQAMRQFAADENPDLERARQELSGLEAQLSAMDVAHNRASGDLVAPKGKVSEAGLEYERALREVKYRETVVGLLMRLCEMARVDEARQGSQAQVVDAAAVPDRPTSLFRIWIALGVLLLSLPMALALALVAEAITFLRGSGWRSGLYLTGEDGEHCGQHRHGFADRPLSFSNRTGILLHAAWSGRVADGL